MKVRVRFAPSPTGFMHIGNVRVALLNYLFARQNKGSFILRIEDTDTNRNLEEAKYRILQDLDWLGLKYDEGPVVGGLYGPYLQSERNDIYAEFLEQLIVNCHVYRCFCSAEDLELKREKQRAMGKPPRYDRTCLHYSGDKIKAKIVANIPFIWRFKLNFDQIVQIDDMAKGIITFEFKNFSDFALTRQDGSATFMFANFVDDVVMKITHVIRGEDHLTNTALQGALYSALAFPLPKFWHLPIICNKDGEKLSKRDFGFSLDDLRKAGYLPETVINYMATMGASFQQEVQTLQELIKNYPFKNLHSAASIRYDVEKITWFNHKWIDRIDFELLKKYIRPILYAEIPQSKELSDEKCKQLIIALKSDLKTLNDIKQSAEFYFTLPVLNKEKIDQVLDQEKLRTACAIITDNIAHIETTEVFVQNIKSEAQKQGLVIKEIFSLVRFLLTGSVQGISLHVLIDLLEKEEVFNRLKIGLDRIFKNSC